MAKHTAGPWRAMSDGERAVIVEVDGPGRIAVVDSDYVTEALRETLSRTGLANAKLIAASPEMWAALRSARAVISSNLDRLSEKNGSYQEAREVLDQIAAALKKAEG